MQKQTTPTKRIIFKKPKQIKQYSIYVILAHLFIFVLIALVLWHALRTKAKTPFINATIVSSIPQQKQVTKKMVAKSNVLQLEKHLRQLQIQHEATQLNLEASRLQQAATSRLIDQAKQKILQRIASYWIVPKQANHHMRTSLLMTLANSGKVQSVSVIKSSGLPILDQSAVYAVKKASPLPLPVDPRLLKQFKQLRLTLCPEKIVHI